MTVLKNAGDKVKYGSIGKAIKNTNIWIKNKGSKVVKPFETGEIVFSGQNIFGGYAQNCNDLKKFKKNKSFNTGDLGFYDESGFIYIKGRKTRFIKIKGIRIDLDEAESRLKNKLNIDIKISGKDNCLNVYITKKVKKGSTEYKNFMMEQSGELTVVLKHQQHNLLDYQ